MTTSAIQSDVPNDAVDNENTEPVKSARELAMESLSQNRNEAFEKESGLKIDTAPDPVEEVDQVAAQLKDKTVLTDGLDKFTVRRKIDGIESEVTINELLRDHQKHGAADKRLAEATAARNEAQRLLQDAQEKQLQQQTENVSGVANNKDVQNPGAKASSETAREFLRTLFEGDEDKALEALTTLFEGRQAGAPTLNEDALALKLAPAIKQQMVVDSASKKFAVDYADIVGDPYLADVADRFLDAELEAGKPFDEALENAGRQTRDWIHEKAGVKPSEHKTTTRNEKLDKKAGIDNVSGTTLKATTVVEQPVSTSDVISQMRASRGLTT